MFDYKALQNGSDIRGIALDGVPGEHVNLGREETFRLTRGFVIWLQDKTGKSAGELKIAVGHDSRVTADFFMNAIIDTLIHIGIKVFDCGLASTPALFMSTVFSEYDCDGAIMITASHLPYNRNGFKYFDKEGGLSKSDISSIISYAQSDIVTDELPNTDTHDTNPAESVDLIGTYSAYLCELIKKDVNAENYDYPLSGLKIVVDAGNGAGGFYASRILEPLGADVSGSQYLDPDGTFPNHQPNPENAAAMASISKRVLAENADLGIIFDTDVDRSAAVDGNGKEISRNRIVALAAALIAKEHPGTTVVTDSITSDELTEYLEKCLGLKHLRFKRGYKNVITKSQELNDQGIDSQLAIETSGHAAYKENYFLDDGAYLATKIVIKAAQLRKQGVGIDAMLSSLKEPKEAMEIRFPITGPDFQETATAVLDDFLTWAKQNHAVGVSIVEPNYEGVRLNFNMNGLRGWCLLRKSLHDPILPLNIEVGEGDCYTILSMITDFLRAYPKVTLV